MKKYQKLIEQKNKLEEKIAQLCNKFTESTGLIVVNASMDLNIEEDKSNIEKYKINPVYKVYIHCEV
jgi:hypothetical protein